MIGDQIRKAREEAGLCLRELARRAHVNAGYLSQIEHGLRTPSAQVLKALGAVLGVELSLPDVVAEQADRIAHVLARPARIDGAAVDALANVLARQRRLDDVLPAVAVLPATAAQWRTVERLARDARGRYVRALHTVAAEWVQFLGWLHAEARNDAEAVRYLDEAERHADDLGDGVLAAQAANFKGYLARQQRRPRAVVRWFLTAYHTPGASPLQRVGDAVQAAHGYAWLGDRDAARRLLGEASDITDAADSDPPDTAYWLSPTFSRLGIGLAHLALGDSREAAEHLRAGLTGLPDDQREAEWAEEYHHALAKAEAA